MVKILTSCPSCLQGLARYQADANIESEYVVVEMARKILGKNWMNEFIDKTNKNGIERVLF